MPLDPRDPALSAFWAERHLCTLTTLRRDLSPHVVPVGVTFDADRMLARVITGGASQKVRNLEQAAAGGDVAATRVAVCQIDGRRWSTLEGTAQVSRDPDEVAEAVVTPITQGETGIGPAMLMEPPSGFEPETYALRVRCSGQLS